MTSEGGSRGEQWRTRDRIDELLYSEISLRRKEFSESDQSERDIELSGERDDLLSVLVLCRDENGIGLTNAEVRDQLVAMLLAGHETTATAIAWAVERLVRIRGVPAADGVRREGRNRIPRCGDQGDAT